MEPSRAKHMSEEDLDRYSMNVMEEQDLAEVEEHLLLCAGCQARVEESDRFVRGMRAALPEYRQQAEQPKAIWWRRPAFAVAFAAAILVTAGLQLHFRSGGPVVAVLLASRGPAVVHSRVPASKPLSLRLDLTDVESSPSYRVELVDRTGKTTWQGQAAATNGQAAVEIPERLAKGRYYVRLYSPSSGLLREYGLEAN